MECGLIIRKAYKLPIDYKIDKEMLKLISEANEKYGEYKCLLHTLEFDAKYFLIVSEVQNVHLDK